MVIGLRDDGRDLVLSIERPDKLGLATRGRDGSDPPLVTLAALLDTAGGRRLTVEAPGGQRHTLIAAAGWRTGVGAGRGVWTALMPSAAVGFSRAGGG